MSDRPASAIPSLPTLTIDIAFIGHPFMAFAAAAYAVLERIVADRQRRGDAIGFSGNRVFHRRPLGANKLANVEAVNRRPVARTADDAFSER
ncbi:hypothetical protein [Ensifer sp. SSB1]|uniref:hypothetical protein n=1 Tax=Ensifer sp. SSB1 TaxID=2795385 RepID=UPI0025C491F4|nr:hypothetical protein [Ensifer sp. SSB1]